MRQANWRVRLVFSVAIRPTSRSRSYTIPRMSFEAEAPSVFASVTTRPRSRLANVSASMLMATFVARAPLPTMAEILPLASLTSFTVSPASLNSGVSRTFAGRSLSACATRPWNELTMAVWSFIRSFTALPVLQRALRLASKSASERVVERRLIASVIVNFAAAVPSLS